MKNSDSAKVEIMVVDDTPANLRLLSRLLSSRGYIPRLALSGEEALQVAEVRLPDLVLLDINMPDMDGYEVCRRLLREYPDNHPPVIFVSALGEAFDKIKAFEAGGVDYITKPFEISEVFARIENHLNIQRLQTALSRANEELESRVIKRTAELQRQMELFRKFVPETFTRLFKEGSMGARETLAREEVYTVLCCDIRNFTDFSESVNCTECYAFLNSYFSIIEPGIRAFGGFVYQFMGDGIMALFEPEDDGYVDQAVRAAITIQQQILVDYNEGRRKGGYSPIEIGIGLNTGPTAIGVAGTDERLDACAVGNTVNLAARCEMLTRDFHENLIITEYTRSLLRSPGEFEIRSLGFPRIKGMTERIELFGISESL